MSRQFNYSLQKFFSHLQKFAHHAWYLPLVASLAALDLFIFVVPTDTLLIATVVVRPRERWKIAAWFTTASALGGLLMASLTQYVGDWARLQIGRLGFSAELWQRLEIFIGDWGGLAMILHSAGPFPLQPGVLVAAAAQMSLVTLFITIWIGRALKYGFFAWAASYAPHLLEKYFFIKLNEISPSPGSPE